MADTGAAPWLMMLAGSSLAGGAAYMLRRKRDDA
jgi:LPXTG-motif cell wall-anchored protein